MAAVATDRRVRLSLLWVFVMLNMIFADIISFMSADVLRQFLDGHADQIAITPGFQLLIAVVTEIPIAMVVLTLVLPQRAARWASLVAAPLTIVYVIGGGVLSAPHYVFIAGIETLACVVIAWTAWTWREHREAVPARAAVTAE
jgi:hypothetical protein